MQRRRMAHWGAMGLTMMLAAGHAGAETAAKHDHAHTHSAVSKGYFEDHQVQPRALGDWEGEWQSVYAYLQDGTLDPVMAHKAEHGDKSAAEYRAYYDTGYKTDITHITIEGAQVTFTSGTGAASGQYQPDGHEVLTYAKGNRGVRYVFRKVSGDKAAPGFIQFSDHIIAPQKADHFHLYWGDDRQALLAQLQNWPTYYPASLSGPQIADEMMAH